MSIIIPPTTRYLRMSQILGDPKADPPIPAILPIGRTTFLNGIKSGKFPKPLKCGDRINIWRDNEIYAGAEKLASFEKIGKSS